MNEKEKTNLQENIFSSAITLKVSGVLTHLKYLVLQSTGCSGVAVSSHVSKMGFKNPEIFFSKILF